MKTAKRRTAASASPAAFWDTSAIVPLCCYQPMSSRAHQAARTYNQQIVWWVTPVEAASALNRLSREGYLSLDELRHSFGRLEYLSARWSEVQPLDDLREQSKRLLRVHSLRAADSLQLAAALTWCRNRTTNRTFISADGPLACAAEAEGFAVLLL